jgi:hypothetical protein
MVIIIIIHVPKGAVLLLFMSPKGRYYYYSCPQRGGIIIIHVPKGAVIIIINDPYGDYN